MSLERITVENAHRLQPLAQIKERGQPVWMPDSRTVAVIGSTGIAFYESASPASPPRKIAWPQEEKAHKVAFNPHRQQLAVNYWQGKDVKIYDFYDFSSYEPLLTIEIPQPIMIRNLHLSPDGLWLVLEGAGCSWLWETQTGRLVRELSGFYRLTFSPDGTRLACIGDGNLRIIELASEHEQVVLTYHTLRVMQAAFNPAGTLLAVCGNSYGPALIMENSTNNLDAILSPALSAAQEEIKRSRLPIEEIHQNYRALSDTPVRLWNVQNGTPVHLESTLGFEAWSVGFSPDGSILAAGQGNSWSASNPIQLWEVQTQRELVAVHQNPQHRAANPVRTLAFSPDGTQLLGDGGLTSQIHIWGTR